jgi:modulator of FtsH protease
LSVAEWSSYASVLAEVAATLTGLVFVAVSINLSRVIATPGLPGRAAETTLQLFGVVMIASSALIPRLPDAAFGMEILIVAAALWLTQTAFQIAYVRRKPDHPRWWAVARMIQSGLATAPFCICGILLLCGAPGALYWLPIGCILSCIAGLAGAWVLLVEILR